MKPEACATHASEISPRPELRIGPDGALANVLVAVAKPPAGVALSADPVVLNQHCVLFEPRVVAVGVGQPLEIRNTEKVFHNVHGLPRRNLEFNFGHASGEKVLRFDTPEIGFKVKCDFHAWEAAWIHVFEHPYFAVTGYDGAFEIRGLPPGEYRLFVWHEAFRENPMEQMVRIADGIGANVDLTVKVGK